MNIEEIKKEIEKISFNDGVHADIVMLDNALEILDKYKDKEYTPASIKDLTREQLEQFCVGLMEINEEKTKFVRAWEELKEWLDINKGEYDENTMEIVQDEPYIEDILLKAEEIAKKHGIEVE